MNEFHLWKARAAATDFTKSLLCKTHSIWARVLPDFYYPYKFGGGRIYLNVTESKMMLLRALGRYEVARHKALEKFLTKGGTFIDVGANKGDFTLLASRLVGQTGRIFAFEPAPDNCRWISKSIDRNGYQNINLSEIALSDNNSYGELYLGAKSGWHSLVGKQGRNSAGSIRVRTQRLDDFLEEIEYRKSVDAIKIDVEGAELQVLQGAHATLTNNESVILFLDVHPELGVDVREVFAFLRELGFSFFAEAPPFEKEISEDAPEKSLIAMRA